MQAQGYSSNGRKLVKTGVPGIYRRGGRYVVIVRDPSGRPGKHAAATMKEARATKAALTAHVASRGVSAGTVLRAVAPVRCLLADAHEGGLIRSNPAAGLRLALPAE